MIFLRVSCSARHRNSQHSPLFLRATPFPLDDDLTRLPAVPGLPALPQELAALGGGSDGWSGLGTAQVLLRTLHHKTNCLVRQPRGPQGAPAARLWRGPGRTCP